MKKRRKGGKIDGVFRSKHCTIQKAVSGKILGGASKRRILS